MVTLDPVGIYVRTPLNLGTIHHDSHPILYLTTFFVLSLADWVVFGDCAYNIS